MVKNDYFNLVVSFIILILGFTCNLHANSLIAVSLWPNSEYAHYGIWTTVIFILGLTFTFGMALSVDYYIPIMHHFKKNTGIRLFNTLYFVVLFRRIIAAILIITCGYIITLFLNHIHILHLKYDVLKLYGNFLLFPLGASLISMTFYYARMIRAYKHPLKAILIYQLLPYFFLLVLVYCFSFHSYVEYWLDYVLAWGITALLARTIFYRIHNVNFDSADIHLHQSSFLKHFMSFHDLGSRTFKVAFSQLVASMSDYIFMLFIVIFSTINHNSLETSFAVAIGTLSLFYFIIVKTMSSICKPQIRLFYITNPTYLKSYLRKMFIVSLSLSCITLLFTIIYGRVILVHFYGNDYAGAYISYCVASLGFVLVEGFIVKKLLIEQVDPFYASKIVTYTSIITLALMAIGSFFSLLMAMIAFVIGRFIYTVWICLWTPSKH